MSGVPRDPWHKLASRTSARIGLGRVGASLPTREVLAFGLAHAQARDAVHALFDPDALAVSLTPLGLASVKLDTQAGDRATYLRRPDLGRRLSTTSVDELAGYKPTQCDLAIVIGDGLSALAVHAHAVDLVAAFQPLAVQMNIAIGPVALVRGARVAVGDVIGAALYAEMVVVLIGERPGLSAADSLGAYLTYRPGPTKTDADRNCISNIRPGGLPPAMAARRLAWLVGAARDRQLTGVGLKDESESAALSADRSPGITRS
jgi:ethanolamine ammonia-lyase small subunit